MGRFVSTTEAETRAIAARLAERMAGGEVIALSGGLGAGKTVFTKGFAKALGLTCAVTSPTFTLLNVYEGGRLTLCHADCYRLKDTDEAVAAGLTDFLHAPDTVCVIEWPDSAAPLFDREQTIHVTVTPLSETEREIQIGIDL